MTHDATRRIKILPTDRLTVEEIHQAAADRDFRVERTAFSAALEGLLRDVEVEPDPEAADPFEAHKQRRRNEGEPQW